VIGRLRPRALIESGLVGVEPFSVGYLTSSFPSGHSQTVGAVAAALILAYPRYDLAYVAVAAVIGYSRVVTLHHYLSDVLAGLWLGAAAAVLIYNRAFARRGLAVGVRPAPPAGARSIAPAEPLPARERAPRPSRLRSPHRRDRIDAATAGSSGGSWCGPCAR